jgi:hypothetical protein
MSKAKEIIDIFEQDQPSLPGIPGGRISPEKGSYPFLKMVEDPEKLASNGFSDLKLDRGTGEINIMGDPEVIINYDSSQDIKDYMDLDKKLTKEVQKVFDSYDGGGWLDWREEWVKSKKWKLGEFRSGNTYEDDNYYFWGSVFEYTTFKDAKGKSGAVIMWHRGGDVRGNYSDPEVWLGDFESFYSSQHIGDPDEEIAHIMGYEGDSDRLKSDLEDWKAENYKG